MQQSKAYVIKNATRNLKATIAAARKADYLAYRYGDSLTRKPPNARATALPYAQERER